MPGGPLNRTYSRGVGPNGGSGLPRAGTAGAAVTAGSQATTARREKVFMRGGVVRWWGGEVEGLFSACGLAPDAKPQAENKPTLSSPYLSAEDFLLNIDHQPDFFAGPSSGV